VEQRRLVVQARVDRASPFGSLGLGQVGEAASEVVAATCDVTTERLTDARVDTDVISRTLQTSRRWWFTRIGRRESVGSQNDCG
jgi:hypothetical protein